MDSSQKNPGVSHTKAANVTDLFEYLPVASHAAYLVHYPLTGHPSEVSNHCAIHCNASDAVTSTVRVRIGGDIVTWALVDDDVADIRSQTIGFVPAWFTIILRGLPTFLTGTPTYKFSSGRASGTHRSIWNQVFVPIIIVHRAGKSDLVLIAHAIGASGFALGLGKGAQQHRGENGDDSNDNEQFDQSETVHIGGTRMTTDTNPRLVSYIHINPGQ